MAAGWRGRQGGGGGREGRRGGKGGDSGAGAVGADEEQGGRSTTGQRAHRDRGKGQSPQHQCARLAGVLARQHPERPWSGSRRQVKKKRCAARGIRHARSAPPSRLHLVVQALARGRGEKIRRDRARRGFATCPPRQWALVSTTRMRGAPPPSHALPVAVGMYLCDVPRQSEST